MHDHDPSLTAFNNLANSELTRKMNELNAAGVQMEMPKYKCHKQVWALKIGVLRDPTEPGNESDGSRIIIPVEPGYAPFKVDADFVRKHKPEAGGYYVVYADGYKSYSPAKAFEDGYTKI